MLSSIPCEGKLPALGLKYAGKSTLILRNVEGIGGQKSLLETTTGMNEFLVPAVFLYFFPPFSYFPRNTMKEILGGSRCTESHTCGHRHSCIFMVKISQKQGRHQQY